MDVARQLMAHYQAMLNFFGPQHWWPGETPLEVMVGAVLAQNTSWTNVERAIGNLKFADMMDVEKLAMLRPEELAELIKPAGYFRVKAKRLQNLMRHLWKNYDGDLERFFQQSVESLREELLSISGIGPETTDDIVLYAAKKPTFVVDTYTFRIMLRHFFITQDADYQAIKETFEENLPAEVELFNEFHALLVAVGKKFCKPRNPLCPQCPLNGFDHNPNLPEEF